MKSPFLPCPASFRWRRASSLFLTLDHHHPHLIKSISSRQNRTTSPFLSASLLISTLFFLIVLSSAIPSSLWFRWAATFSVTVNVYVFHQQPSLLISSISTIISAPSFLFIARSPLLWSTVAPSSSSIDWREDLHHHPHLSITISSLISASLPSLAFIFTIATIFISCSYLCLAVTAVSMLIGVSTVAASPSFLQQRNGLPLLRQNQELRSEEEAPWRAAITCRFGFSSLQVGRCWFGVCVWLILLLKVRLISFC